MGFLNINQNHTSFDKVEKRIHIPSFLITISVLALVNVILSCFLELQELRIVRLVTTIIFFGWFLKFKFLKKGLFTLVFALLVLSDLGIFFYENKWFCFLRFISFILFQILLSFHILKRTRIKKLKPIALGALLVLFISCLFLVINLSSILDFTVFGIVHQLLFYLYTITTLVLIFLSVFYNLEDYSKKADMFFGAIVSFLVSDILLMVGYYQDFYVAIQIERFFHIVAIALLLYYVILLSQNTQNE